VGDPLSLRTAREDDLSRIAELEYLVFKETGFSFSALMQLFGPSGPTWLVAEDQTGIWGYSLSARATDDAQVGWIMALGVHPERRGEHIGSHLLGESIAELQDKGINTIKLTVLPDNAAAVNLYLRAGFKDTGLWKEGDIGDGRERMILTLLLPTE